MFIIYKERRVHYIKNNGNGYPIVFLHGWGGSTKSFEYFAKGKNSIIIDFPPFGMSKEPKYAYTLDDYVNIVIKIIKKEKIEKINIVAHSFGGRVALALAAKGFVNKMVLTGSAGLKPKYSLKRAFAKFRFKMAKFIVKLKLKDKSYLNKFGSSDYKSLSGIMKKTFVNIVNFYQNDMLNDVKCDTLLIWGSNDTETPLYMAKTFEKKIKGSGLVIFKNCGHFAYIEKAFAFEKIINNFFKD